MSAAEKPNEVFTLEQMHSNGVEEGLKTHDEGRVHVDEGGFQTDTATLPKGYYYSPFFLGSFIAIGLGFWAGNSGFTYAAPILPTINADIGPDPNIQWVALVHPVGLSVGMVSLNVFLISTSGTDDTSDHCWTFRRHLRPQMVLHRRCLHGPGWNTYQRSSGQRQHAHHRSNGESSRRVDTAFLLLCTG